jgi:type IV pilus assembly protein PilQ
VTNPTQSSAANNFTNALSDAASNAVTMSNTTSQRYPQNLIGTALPLLVNLPAANPSGAINFLIGRVGSYLLQLELSAMQREGRGEIISSPRVITSDTKKATITMGQEIPYQQQTGGATGGTNIAFKKAALELSVTPQITPDDRILMDLKVNKDAANRAEQQQGQPPPIDTRSVETSVLVDNGETVILGGVYETEKGYTKEQVPWLGDVPMLGRLFKQDYRKDSKSELLIFVTPKILKEGMDRE